MEKKIKEKISFSSILKGKFLVDSLDNKNWKFLMFIFFLAFLMIFSSHSLNSKVSRITELKEETDELHSQFAQIHSKLMKIRLESVLATQVYSDSLKSLEKNPFKIIVSKQNDN